MKPYIKEIYWEKENDMYFSTIEILEQADERVALREVKRIQQEENGIIFEVINHLIN